MILYTYTAEQSIFPVDDREFLKQKMIDIPGGHLLLEKDEGENNDGYRIVRLYSTDPNMYLNQQYTPGQRYTLE
ncbi:YlzJ-like family protein [Evansella sp. AB-P1]|uniref:YlzJ-like family protein n=1 Tax=Evansella sp. AB-P1 TaxID=3037653 RepID=UPI00241CD797|nr:YlzJ-like family protein [Evansella sp. AB-P1]MDG5789008.1 YlzJ-like family protein [Evansella sp. AB-P1]